MKFVISNTLYFEVKDGRRLFVDTLGRLSRTGGTIRYNDLPQDRLGIYHITPDLLDVLIHHMSSCDELYLYPRNDGRGQVRCDDPALLERLGSHPGFKEMTVPVQMFDEFQSLCRGLHGNVLLESLDITHPDGNPDWMREVCALLTHNKSIKTLSLGWIPLTPETLPALIDALRANPVIERIDIDHYPTFEGAEERYKVRPLTPDDLRSLLSCVRQHPTLKVIRVTSPFVTDLALRGEVQAINQRLRPVGGGMILAQNMEVGDRLDEAFYASMEGLGAITSDGLSDVPKVIAGEAIAVDDGHATVSGPSAHGLLAETPEPDWSDPGAGPAAAHP